MGGYAGSVNVYKFKTGIDIKQRFAPRKMIGDWRRYIDDRPVFRQFYCPGCGALIENEVARENDEVLRDIELRLR